MPAPQAARINFGTLDGKSNKITWCYCLKVALNYAIKTLPAHVKSLMLHVQEKCFSLFWKLVVFACSLLKDAPSSLTLFWRSMSVLVVHLQFSWAILKETATKQITRTFVTKLSGRGLINRHLSQYVMNIFIRQNFTCPTSFQTLISRLF